MQNRIMNKKWHIITIMIITIVLSIFVTQKEGYHMDELLSFELANAEFNPWIVPTQPVGRLAKLVSEEIEDDSFLQEIHNVVALGRDYLQNRESSIISNYNADIYEESVWISRDSFQKYVTVDSKDAFNYLSVYFNVKDDNHPPIHFMLLHTISSFFRNQIAPWMGCMINVAAILVCCMLIIRIGNILYEDKRFGFMAALLYALSSGGIATSLLIRMYALLTMFCIWSLYLHLNKLKNENWRTHNKLLVLITVMGFWTQYFYLFFIIPLAIATIMYLIRKKQGKEVLYYVRTMAIAAVIGVVVYPFSIGDVFFSSRGQEVLDKAQGGLQGIVGQLLGFGQILLQRMPGGIIGLACVTVLIVFVIWRKEQIHMTFEWIVLVPMISYFLLAAKLSPFMVDRYIMVLFPLVAIVIGWLLEKSRINMLICAVIMSCLCTLGIVGYDGEYLYKGYNEQLQIAAQYSDYPCICIYEGTGYYDNLVEFTQYRETLLVTPEELASRGQDEVLEDQKKIIILVKQGIDSDMIRDILLDRYNLEVSNVLLDQGVHGDEIWVCE